MGLVFSKSYKALITYEILAKYRQERTAGIPPDLKEKLENASQESQTIICHHTLSDEKRLVLTNTEIQTLARLLSIPQ